jgi:hypothetical protein
MNAEDETNVTDIELLPDGRICVFGASAEVLQVLDRLQGGGDGSLTARLAALGSSPGVSRRHAAAVVTED